MIDSSAYSVFEIHYNTVRPPLGNKAIQHGVARIVATNYDAAVTSLENMLDNPVVVTKAISSTIDRMVLEV